MVGQQLSQTNEKCYSVRCDPFYHYFTDLNTGKWPQVLCVRRCLNRSHQCGREIETANTRPCATRRIREDGGAGSGGGREEARLPEKKSRRMGAVESPQPRACG